MLSSFRTFPGKTFFGAVLGLLLIGQAQCPAQDSGASARLEGTFLQLTDAHRQWEVDQWRQLFDYFRQLHLSQLIVQWTVRGQSAFYASGYYEAGETPPLETILNLADEAGVSVRVGLAHDPEYWQRINRRPASVDSYLRQSRFRSLSVAKELVPIVEAHSCFQGWYVTEEIDDVNWLEPPLRQILFDHLGRLTAELRALTPTAEISLSGFSNANTDPVAFEKFWNGLLEATEVDVVLLQDGIGVDKLDLDYLELYLAAARKAVDGKERDLQVVVEVFQQVDGLPINDKPFRAVPASLERIARQLEQAARYSPAGSIAFSIPEYMTPLGGQDAGQLFQGYLKTLPEEY